MSDNTQMSSTNNRNENIYFLWLNLSLYSRTTQFLVLSTATFVYYLLYGYMQELMYKLPDFGQFPLYLTLVQFFFYSSFGYIENKIRNRSERCIPWKIYLLLAFLTIATMALSNASVAHLNYPTQVMFKCCKLIPVMIGGVFIQAKKYNIYDISACLCMTIGLIFFTLADQIVQPNFEFIGVVLVCGALCADAIIGNVQEKQMKLYKACNNEVVLYSYSIGFVYMLFIELFFDRFIDAFLFWLQNPIKTYLYAFIFSICGYMGVNVVLDLVKHFGALLAVTVTTCRKAITIVCSFILFTKPFTFQYLWSGLLVIIGIYLNLYSKNKDKWTKSMLIYKFKRLFNKNLHNGVDLI